jgi:D-glycero-alpha-D-manno-heptose-7-phosphate kinase
VNGWQWNYSSRETQVIREKLLDNNGMKQLSKRILVAYSGKCHVSASTNRAWLNNFLEGRTRSGWLEANTVVRELIKSVKSMEWGESIRYIKEEMKLRRRITPDALIPETSRLIKDAEKTGCGARFAGAGAGGALWALGEPEDIDRLKNKWEKSFSKIKGAYMLQCAVDPKGVY